MQELDFFKKQTHSKNIMELVEMLLSRYELFFGREKNISFIACFITGYITSKIDLGIESKEDEIFHNNFSIWVCRKYHLKYPINWSNYYSSLPVEQERKIELFYKDFKDFFSVMI